MKKIFIITLSIFASLMSCKNGEWEFPDYEYQTVYFAYQYPVRTITLGEDIFDTSLDNEHKCKIMSTTGGVYDNDKSITIDIEVDNTLCDGLLYSTGGDPVLPMPTNYYSLASNQIVIPKGEQFGGVEVQLTDAFFADANSIQTTYVIPVCMTEVQNADSILAGAPIVDNPIRTNTGDWDIQPMDFVLYAVKYINPWHGYYLRRGEDEITGKNGNTDLDQTIERHEEYVEDDEVNSISTYSMNQVEYPLVFKDAEGNNIDCILLLTFDDNQACTVSTNSESFTATGSGKFVTDGEKNSWGNKDRDAIYLEYEIDLPDMHIASTDTLVMRNRGVEMERFSPVQE